MTDENESERYDEYVEERDADIEYDEARRKLQLLEEEYEDPQLEQLKDEAELRRQTDLMEGAFDLVRDKQNKVRQDIAQLQSDNIRRDWEERLRAADRVTDDASYQKYLSERDQIIEIENYRRKRDKEPP